MNEITDARRQAYLALGYLSVFLPGLLLMVGHAWHADWLLIFAFFAIFPLLRVAFGDVPNAAPVWSERWAAFLHQLPGAYTLFFVALTAWVAWMLSREPQLAGLNAVLFGISWWLVNSLATCVSHELLHRREPTDRLLGRWLAAAAGYPILGQEHLSHHAHPGDIERAEYARADESVWRYALRRTTASWRHALEWDRGEAARQRGRWRLDGLEACVAITLGCWTLFSAVGGSTGFLLYLAQIVGVHFSIQVITYLQHWGLGDDAFPEAAIEQYSWEDTCQLQAWLVMGLSLHHAHHLRPSLAYYRLGPRATSPRPPAAYAWMMLIALVPALWRRAMTPALDYWKRNPNRPLSPGRRLHCFGHYSSA
jgi:alkane 1-monooxygenase